MAGFYKNSSDKYLYSFLISLLMVELINLLRSGNGIDIDYNNYTANLSGSYNGTFSTTQLALTQSTSSISGITGGYVYYEQPQVGVYKKFVAYFDKYVNNSSTNQTIDFQVAFKNSAGISFNNVGLVISASLTGITIFSAENTNQYSGLLIVEGI